MQGMHIILMSDNPHTVSPSEFWMSLITDVSLNENASYINILLAYILACMERFTNYCCLRLMSLCYAAVISRPSVSKHFFNYAKTLINIGRSKISVMENLLKE